MREQNRPGLSSRIFLQGVLLRNPVLVQVIGLCPAVAAAADLYVSALLSVLVTGLLIICECVASLLLKKVPRRVRVVIYFLIGLFVCAETAFFLEQNAPEVRERAGIYLSLMAASSVVALRCEKCAVKQKLRVSFLDAFANGVGTSLVLLTSGLVRGLLGSGMIGDRQVFSTPPLRGLSMPFGGFIVLGFLAAFLKWFSSVFLEQEAQMAFGIQRTKRKKPIAVESIPQQTDAAAQQPAAQAQTQPSEQTPPQPQSPSEPEPDDETPPEDAADNPAEEFYEQASDDPDEELTGDLFSSLDFSVQAEVDAILESIEGMSPTEGQANTDA
jgi:electron transport complex protein RnfE